MISFPVIERIRRLCEQRGWSIYRLAKESGIAYSTLNTLMIKTNTPSIPTLQRICDGLGITLSQFFSDGNDGALTVCQANCLSLFNCLSEQDQRLALIFLSGLAHRLPEASTAAG